MPGKILSLKYFAVTLLSGQIKLNQVFLIRNYGERCRKINLLPKRRKSFYGQLYRKQIIYKLMLSSPN
jgi:hypothetical protein